MKDYSSHSWQLARSDNNSHAVPKPTVQSICVNVHLDVMLMLNPKKKKIGADSAVPHNTHEGVLTIDTKRCWGEKNVQVLVWMLLLQSQQW